MRPITIWRLRQRQWRTVGTGWWVLRSRTLTFERLHANYPNHDISWVTFIPAEEI
jgi:hypothetical protein